MQLITFAVSATFQSPNSKGYIAAPYTPELYRFINITKESGMNRARSNANRRKSLEDHLRTIGMTHDQFLELERAAKEPFYRANGPESEIVIPDNHVYGFLVATCDTLRTNSRPCPADQVRSRIRATSWTTGKTKQDGIWERFATVTSGSGAKLSNQRSLRSDPYIVDFTAEGTMAIDAQQVRPEVLEQAIRLGADQVGIGASRKMGWGRFELTRFERLSA